MWNIWHRTSYISHIHIHFSSWTGYRLEVAQVGWEKVAYWSTEAAIYLKRVKIEKSYYGGLIGTHQRSFKQYHPQPSTTSFSPRLGVRNSHQKLQSLLSGMGKAADFKFGRYIHRVHPNKSPLKFWRKRNVGVSRDCPNVLSTPCYLRNAYCYGLQICTYIKLIGSNETKAH